MSLRNSINYSTPSKEKFQNKKQIHSTISLKKKKNPSDDFTINNNIIKTQNGINKENLNGKNLQKEINKITPFTLKNSNSMNNLHKNNLITKNKKENKNEKKFNLYEPHITIDPLDCEDSYYKAQIEYSKNLDVIYKEKYNKLREIKLKYDYCIYEMKKIYGDENKDLFRELREEKQSKISELNDDFLIKKNLAKMKFKEKIREIQNNSINERKNLFEGKIFDEMRNKIYNILNQPMITYEIPDDIEQKEIKNNFIIKDNPNYRGN